MAYWVALGAAIVAFFAWRTNLNSFRTSFRPVLRVAKLSVEETRVVRRDRILLKNIGRGPAISVVLVDAVSGAIIGETDAVEPLAGTRTGGGEASRIGRVELPLIVGAEWRDATTYCLFYQDLFGAWHQTEFIAYSTGGFAPNYLGRHRSILGWTLGVPKPVQDRARIARTPEML